MPSAAIKVLVIDDEMPVCISCKRILEEDGHQVDYILSGREGVKKAVAGDYHLILLDLKMQDMSGMEALELIRKDRPELSVIIITGYASIQTSIEAIKKGAFDYVPKPFTPDELSIVVSKAIETMNLKGENEYLKRELSKQRLGGAIIGRSKVIEDVLHQVHKIAATDFSVLIYGESGTGKELIAAAIHENSPRREKPFVAVDISALSSNLIESELFGHVKGAFTGALQNKPGYFSIAHGGTLFLDEVSNVSWELQGKLLRAIESRKIRPVGSEQESEVNVRIIAATNKELHTMVKDGKFREDLYYRLNVIPIALPPLRERSEDIPILATHFLERATEQAPSRLKGFSTEAMAKLMAYRWPGNIRQLKNQIERLVATVDAEFVGLDHLPPEISGQALKALDFMTGEVPTNSDELKEVKARLKEMVYGQVEKEFVLSALNRAGWNVTRASELVGMLRPNFHALMRKYGIRSREDGEG